MNAGGKRTGHPPTGSQSVTPLLFDPLSEASRLGSPIRMPRDHQTSEDFLQFEPTGTIGKSKSNMTRMNVAIKQGVQYQPRKKPFVLKHAATDRELRNGERLAETERK